MTRVRILSRSSDLARAQAREVGRAISARWPAVELVYLTREAAGDKNRALPLAEATDKGLFTADLSVALARDDADLVVHSWKDLPIEKRAGTLIAGSLRRADPRDVLVVRQSSVDRRPETLTVLTSSPRRAWQLRRSIAGFLPWRVDAIEPRLVRGNVPTRLDALVDSEADALVVAKAALDRLLEAAASPAAARVRAALTSCRWMVLPISRFPTAPAQGALAVEVSEANVKARQLVAAIAHGPTFEACQAERAILAARGGGCHQAIGATVLERDYGTLTSVQGLAEDGQVVDQWTLRSDQAVPPSCRLEAIWPRPDERGGQVRRPRATPVELTRSGVWITRAEALPEHVVPQADQLVWTAGIVTWQKLARRGIWVQGCADGLGDEERPSVDLLAGRPIDWQRLSHGGTNDPDATVTYDVEFDWPEDLAWRTHFYWTSGSALRDALARFPAIRHGYHASGPGQTARAVAEVIGTGNRVSIWLDYDSWLTTITR